MTAAAGRPIFRACSPPFPPSPALTVLPPRLRTHRKLPGYEFSVINGTVLSEATFPLLGGSTPPSDVNNLRDCYRKFVVRKKDGKEVELHANAAQVQVQEGHRVTLVMARSVTEGHRQVVRLWNHDAPEHSGVVRDTKRRIAPAPPVHGCLESFLLAAAALKVGFAVFVIPTGVVGGLVAGGLMFAYMIKRSFRQGPRRRRKLRARRAVYREHLARISKALSLSTEAGRVAVPAW